jgi:hypothetical protein
VQSEYMSRLQDRSLVKSRKVKDFS